MRHGGFIPWDDDVDVMFTRKNYEMFAKVVRRELPEDMSFVEPNEYHGGKAFYDFISRVTYNKSQKFEDSGKMEFYDDKISRLNVDLFIVDGLPEGKLAKKLTKLSHCVLYGFALGHREWDQLSDGRENWFYVEMKREWDDEVVEMPFEDTRFYAPAGWDELLTQLYGDYMKLPPKEKQIPEHSDMEIKIYD